jgi:5-methylcytosine-specific restriction endonuclease McrA
MKIWSSKEILKDLERMRAEHAREEEVERELYSERDLNLKLLGFDDYRAYRKSDRYWRGRSGIRQRILRRDKSLCVCCGAKSNHIVHHRRYTMEALTGKDDDALITLCRDCHFDVEFRFRPGFLRSVFLSGLSHLPLYHWDLEHGRMRRTREEQEWIIYFKLRENMGLVKGGPDIVCGEVLLGV